MVDSYHSSYRKALHSSRGSALTTKLYIALEVLHLQQSSTELQRFSSHSKAPQSSRGSAPTAKLHRAPEVQLPQQSST